MIPDWSGIGSWLFKIDMYWGSALIDEDWLELACIGMDWPRLADWKIVVERGYRVWNDPILTFDWHWIGAGLTWDRCSVCNGLDPNWHWMVTGWLEFRPPSGLGTIPYREIVPRLSRQMSLDWAEIDIGLARIGIWLAWKVVMELLLALCRPLLRHLALLCWLGTLCWNERLAVDWLGVDWHWH